MDYIETLNPLDSRYKTQTYPLVPFFSDFAFFKYRVTVEIEYLIFLLNITKASNSITKGDTDQLREIQNVTNTDFNLFKRIEKQGYKKIKATNHDVKAIEYFIKEKLRSANLDAISQYVHFALTSDDTNNLAYALMISDSLEKVIIPEIETIYTEIFLLAKKYSKSVLLAKTHGQPATPTTFGKEMNVYATRLEKKLHNLKTLNIGAKLNGATGTYAAHYVAFPNVNWIKFTKDFIQQLNTNKKVKLKATILTTQIEPHDSLVELFDDIRHVNNILMGLDQDIWNYISNKLIIQKLVSGEIGSSTMPHKINPIDFENSEGNLGISNSILIFLSNKLPISRLQRDLSDSTVMRNIGTSFGYSLVGYKSLLKGLSKISFNDVRAQQEISEHPEVLSEAIQVILKKDGIKNGYEIMKDLSQNTSFDMNKIVSFLESAKVSKKTIEYIKNLKSSEYIGIASKLSTLQE
jgi:adenylosuccinate lyase